MTNIASALKAEIVRVARKQIRSEIEPLRKTSAHQRATISQLKRDLAELQKAVKQGRRAQPAPAHGAPVGASAGEEGEGLVIGVARRFSASRMAAHRAKLELSAADYGRLIGMSGATIYNWEQGKSRPGPKQVQSLAMLKLQSPRAIRARLAEVG